MKTYITLTAILLLSLTGCRGQEKTDKGITEEKMEKEQPKGVWKVDKEYDENGNLIRYDSIYSWSSGDTTFSNLAKMNRDSLLGNLESRFYGQFSQFRNQGFEDVFEPDSLFSKRYFNNDFFGSDFGEEFIELDNVYQSILERRKRFLEKYRSDFVKRKDSL